MNLLDPSGFTYTLMDSQDFHGFLRIFNYLYRFYRFVGIAAFRCSRPGTAVKISLDARIETVARFQAGVLASEEFSLCISEILIELYGFSLFPIFSLFFCGCS